MVFMTKKKILYFNILFLLIAGIAFSACSKGSSYNTTTTTPPVAANAVSIAGMAFSPATLTVAIGTTVIWTNNDGMTHTVTSDATNFDSGDLVPGSKFSQVFSVAGTYPYHCTIHPTMKGTIVVK
jgi:plastocyanin